MDRILQIAASDVYTLNVAYTLQNSAFTADSIFPGTLHATYTSRNPYFTSFTLHVAHTLLSTPSVLFIL